MGDYLLLLTNFDNFDSTLSGHKTHGLQKIPLFQVIDPADMLDPDLCTPFNVVAVPANSNEHDEDVLGGASGTDQGLHSRTVGRLRHLDILEEVGCLF